MQVDTDTAVVVDIVVPVRNEMALAWKLIFLRIPRGLRGLIEIDNLVVID